MLGIRGATARLQAGGQGSVQDLLAMISAEVHIGDGVLMIPARPSGRDLGLDF